MIFMNGTKTFIYFCNQPCILQYAQVAVYNLNIGIYFQTQNQMSPTFPGNWDSKSFPLSNWPVRVKAIKSFINSNIITIN